MIKHRSELYKIIDLSLPTAEVGCAESYFSAEILSWGNQIHYLIDNWGHINGQRGDGGNSQEWHEQNLIASKQRVAKYGDRAVFLRGLSVDMAEKIPDNSLGFVNIDCDHSFEGVTADIRAYWPKLAKGGVMAFHDYLAPQYGVYQAVGEFAKLQGLRIYRLPENKPEDAGAYIIKIC